MKAKNKNRVLFGPGGCITRQAIEWFIDNKLSDTEIKKLQHHAKTCKLCADSLEGARHFGSGIVFNSRITSMLDSRWRRSIDRQGKSRRLFYGITTAAASITVIFGVYYILQMKQVVEYKKDIADLPDKTEHVSDKNDIVGKTYKPLTEAEPTRKTNISEPKAKQEKKEVLKPKEKIVVSEPEIKIEEKTIDFESMPLENLDEIEVSKSNKVINSESKKAEESGYAEASPVADQTKLKKSTDDNADTRVRVLERRQDKSQAKQTYYVAEVTPLFKGGGADKFSKYIADSLKVILPDTILTQSIVIGFRIDTLGNIDKVNLISGTDSREFNNQIINIIKNSPQWIPANISGHPVASEQQIEVVLGK